jgi:hypothetical protein
VHDDDGTDDRSRALLTHVVTEWWLAV